MGIFYKNTPLHGDALTHKDEYVHGITEPTINNTNNTICHNVVLISTHPPNELYVLKYLVNTGYLSYTKQTKTVTNTHTQWLK